LGGSAAFGFSAGGVAAAFGAGAAFFTGAFFTAAGLAAAAPSFLVSVFPFRLAITLDAVSSSRAFIWDLTSIPIPRSDCIISLDVRPFSLAIMYIRLFAMESLLEHPSLKVFR